MYAPLLHAPSTTWIDSIRFPFITSTFGCKNTKETNCLHAQRPCWTEAVSSVYPNMIWSTMVVNDVLVNDVCVTDQELKALQAAVFARQGLILRNLVNPAFTFTASVRKSIWLALMLTCQILERNTQYSCSIIAQQSSRILVLVVNTSFSFRSCLWMTAPS